MRKPLLLAAFLLISMASPARAQFCPGVSPWVFDDVAASDPFCSYITWMAENGITLGCVTIDANHRLYCPNANVTRAAMAAFMNRLGNVRVEAVGTGPGLTGGPITSTGTIGLAATQLLPTTACATNQIPRWSGSAWACAADATGTGTVTSVTASTGLTGGTITTSGTVAVDTTYVQRRVSASCAVGSSIRVIAADGTVTCQSDGVGPVNAYVQGGNAFGVTAVLGTTDNNPIDIRANNTRVMRYEPNAISPNVIGGSPANNVTVGVRGATIAGGGVPAVDIDPDFLSEAPNRVTDVYGTVGGGYGNRAGNDAGTVVDAQFATVGGGIVNTASGANSTVGGGGGNSATGASSTVGGGGGNSATGANSTIGGGLSNVASGIGSTVGGGGVRGCGPGCTSFSPNVASGDASIVPGGVGNRASGAGSWAGGNSAMTQTADATPVPHHGAFVWADGGGVPFRSTADNEFAVRAKGGARFVTQIDGSGNVARQARLNPNAELEFGNNVRQMLNLWDSAFGIGVQADTQYFRTNNHFAWYFGGTHADAPLDAGGGSALMTLTNGASTSTVIGTLRAQVITQTSDRAQKRDFAEVDGEAVLARVIAMPIETWAYRNEPAVRHMGPSGQDFRAAFGLGHDEKSIATVDAGGVALAAIQGLNAKVEAQAREIAELRAAHAAEVAELKRAVEVLLARTSPEGRVAAK